MMAHNTTALASSTALSSIGADAEMIATCAAICEGERAYDAFGFQHEIGSPEEKAVELARERISAEQDRLVERLADLPCTTIAGVQAMGRALAAWDRELLKDGPARDNGEVIVSHLVERLLALPLPGQQADADLLAVCAEFRASEAAFTAIYDVEDDEDDAHDALAAAIVAAWSGMLDRMAGLRATTSDGLAARALALAQHSGIKPGCGGYAFEFVPGDNRGGVTGRLLHMLLTDAVQMCGTPPPSPDADLLALRPEFDRLHALMVAYNKDLIPGGGTECADFDALCERIAVAPPAVGPDGRAFQAAAAMHHLYYRLNDEQQARNPAWLMLKGIAGNAYCSVEARV